MKINNKNIRKTFLCAGFLLLALLTFNSAGAQDTTKNAKGKEKMKFKDMKPEKGTFDGKFAIDDQTVMTNQRNTMEFDFQHRFGPVTNGYKDFIGIFGDANIRLGLDYSPTDNLQIGFGFNKYNLTWDFDAKYALMRQSERGKGIWPLSITIYANMAVDTRDKSNFVSGLDRLSYFGQLMIARKFGNFSLQVAAEISYFNNVPGYINAEGGVSPAMYNYLFSVSGTARYKFTDKVALLISYDQPVSQQISANPHPNLSAGVEFITHGHDFQVTFGNFQTIIPQVNNFYNQNDYTAGSFCIGFNVLRLWHL
jgi:hypothetical protein